MEVDQILDLIGEVEEENPETGILSVRRHSDGKILKIADLVRVEGRDRIVEYLRNTDDEDDMDIIIALGMAKKGLIGRIASMH